MWKNVNSNNNADNQSDEGYETEDEESLYDLYNMMEENINIHSMGDNKAVLEKKLRIKWTFRTMKKIMLTQHWRMKKFQKPKMKE